MKTSAGQYAFSKAELKILKEVVRGDYELSSIQAKLSVKPSLLTYTLKKLQSKGLIKLTHKGAKKQLSFSDAKHAILLKELLSIYDYVDWENVLNDKAIEILFQTLSGKDKRQSIPRNTLWRYNKDLKARGIITQADQINPQFRGLSEFLKEYESFFIKKTAESLSEHAVILWQHDLEFIARTAKGLQHIPANFHKTATSMFDAYGLSLFTDFNLYFYSVHKKAIQLEDALLHTLLIEPKNVRYVTYALLLLKKTEQCINKKYLHQEAEKLGLTDQINEMIEFIENHKRIPGQLLPAWDEFVVKAHDYGVMT